MIKIKKLGVPTIWLCSTLFAQLNLGLQPQLTNKTWSFPLSVQVQLNDNLSVFQKYVLTHIDHPTNRYRWFKYQRGNVTFYNDEGYFQYHDKKMELTIGRKYSSAGFGKMSGLFISPISPSMDQITFNLKDINYFTLRNSIIRLDNRSKEWGGAERVVYRWYYLRSIGYNYKDKITINLIDAVIATGFNRGLEWYYMNPLSSLFMERKHQYLWIEGSDTLSVIGPGDNDNHFIGGNIKISVQDWDIYGEVLIDEWQLTADHRDNMQTVFGTIAGVSYQRNKYNIAVEYSYASPWLYLNRALYGGVEQHWQPLGLRAPQSHALDICVDVSFTNSRSLIVQAHVEEKGEQTLSTTWDAWDNKIEQFDFTNTLSVEWRVVYRDNENKIFNKIALYHHWLGSDETFIVISKDWSIQFQ